MIDRQGFKASIPGMDDSRSRSPVWLRGGVLGSLDPSAREMCWYCGNSHGAAARLSSSIELGARKRAWGGGPGDGVSLM